MNGNNLESTKSSENTNKVESSIDHNLQKENLISEEKISGSNKNNKLPMYLAGIALILVFVLGIVGLILFLDNGNENTQDDNQETSQERNREENKEEKNSDIQEEEEESKQGQVKKNNDGTSTFLNDLFSFSYPSNWFFDDSSLADSNIVQVFETNPNELVPGQFLTNVNITYSKTEGFELTGEGCREVADEVITTFEDGIFTSSEIVSASVERINGNKACKIVFHNVIQDFELEQTQFYFHDDSSSTSYIITISLEKNANNIEEAFQIAESFRIE